MKITNFRDFVAGKGEEAASRAMVDLTIGNWLWKRTKAVSVARLSAWGEWFFADTGEYIHEDAIQPAIRVWRANRKPE